MSVCSAPNGVAMVRMSTRQAVCSTTGIMNTRPGPATRLNAPNLKMTMRSHSMATCMVMGASAPRTSASASVQTSKAPKPSQQMSRVSAKTPMPSTNANSVAPPRVALAGTKGARADSISAVAEVATAHCPACNEPSPCERLSFPMCPSAPVGHPRPLARPRHSPCVSRMEARMRLTCRSTSSTDMPSSMHWRTASARTMSPGISSSDWPGCLLTKAPRPRFELM